MVSGIPTTVSAANVIAKLLYAQAFTNGASAIRFPSVACARAPRSRIPCSIPTSLSRLSIGFNRQLAKLNSRGYLPNMRFMYVARTNLATAMEVFRQQVITTTAWRPWKIRGTGTWPPFN